MSYQFFIDNPDHQDRDGNIRLPEPVYITAEIGINHNGDLEIAKKLIDVAVVAGVSAVKFQKRNPDLCVPEKQKSAVRDTPWSCH